VEPAARARIEGWKQSLVDLPAVDCQTTDVPIDPLAALALLERGESVEVTGELLGLRRAAAAQLGDRGENVLWLGLGVLCWSGEREHRSPLALWPVEIDQGRVAAVEGCAPRRNPVLVAQLAREHGIALGEDPLDVAGLLAAAESIAVTRPGWRVERACQLVLARIGTFALARDLEALGDRLYTSPAVAQLCLGTGERLPAVGDPRELIAPLDADASQLAAVAAAGAGKSFVVQGAPGTGKSQTIANLIVHCASLGKSVLFVSDTVPALEVVQQRLAAIGLGDLCVEVYGRKGSRAQVLAQLARVLERSFRPGAVPGADDRLAELRAALDAHVAALHRVGPLGRSLHDVLARLVELRTAPCAELADRDAIGLDAAGFERRRAAVERVAVTGVPVEPVAGHPWRASQLERWPLLGRDRTLAALHEAATAAEGLAAAVRELATRVPGVIAQTRPQLHALGALAALAARSPRPGAELLTQLRAVTADEIEERIALVRARGGAYRSGDAAVPAPRDPLSFLVLAHRHRALRAEVDDWFTEAVAGLDAPALWAQLKKWGRGMAPVKFVALRAVRSQLRAVAHPDIIGTEEQMLEALSAVIAERACRQALEQAREPAARWFGALGGDPLALDLDQLDAAVAWASDLRRAFDAVEVAFGDPGRQSAWRALVAQVAGAATEGDGDLAAFAKLAEAVARWAPALSSLAEVTGIPEDDLAAGDDHLPALAERCELLEHSIDALRDWVSFHAARQAARAAGVGPALAALERGELGAAELAQAWERAALLAWAEAELADTPALARFHGPAHHAHVAAFADLDRAALALVRSRALVKLGERVPRVVRGPLAPDPGGELGSLLRELDRSIDRSGIGAPLRALFAAIPTLATRLAPCVLATPLAVAEHVDPAMRFDVVVFDEASRLATAEALGALARASAVVVVGDARQLAPADGTSILDNALAAPLPELALAAHYRSKHEELFAFVNQRYYDDRIEVLPAAQSSPELGLVWRKVAGDTDAETVVAEVIARLKDPAQCTRSLAVITLGRALRDRIVELLDAARAADAELDAVIELIGSGGVAVSERLIVKDVDDAQGDERDVVLFAVGRALGDEGPLSQFGGERRLAVALTRAREQLIVFSPFTPEDIDPDDAQALRDLGALIAFARSERAPALSEEPASPLTAAIARALGERGWTVRHQIGCGAYKLDLAVVDPSDPSRYVLAIETDGAAYASAPAARDRDRLRPQLLGQLGWRLHRIWALDWWTDPERELARAHSAIVTAVAATRQRRVAPAAAAGVSASARISAGASTGTVTAAGSGPTRATRARGSAPPIEVPAPILEAAAEGSSPGADAVEPLDADGATSGSLAAGSAPIKIQRGAIAIGPYIAAAIPAGRRTPDDLFAPRHLAELGRIVEQVLAAEAPMHVDLLARRVGAYFGVGRLTQRVTDQVRSVLAGRARWGDESNVVWRLDQDPAMVPAVRVAGSSPTGRREIDEIPLAELAAAARIVVERVSTIGTSDLLREAARLVGFARITNRVVDRVGEGIRLATQRELFEVVDGKAQLGASAS
jgi:very-short-patch-repair endonuclease